MAEDVRLQHVLRRALARAGIVTGFEHVCRRHGCGFVQSSSDGELRRRPKDGRKLWPKAHVRPIRWHDLRHTTASLLKAAGVHLVDAQRILRHSDPRITQEVYTHVDLDQLRSAVKRMPVRIDNFPANVDGNVDGGDGRNRTQKNETNSDCLKSGKRDSNCRKAWKYPTSSTGCPPSARDHSNPLPFQAVSYHVRPTGSAGEQHIDST
jgi:Phage integrase family